MTLRLGGVIFLYTFVYAISVLGICRQYKNFELSSMILLPMYFLILSLPFLAILRYGMIIFLFAAIWVANEVVLICQNRQFKLCIAGFSTAFLMAGYIALGY